jgi:hypothetical protein
MVPFRRGTDSNQRHVILVTQFDQDGHSLRCATKGVQHVPMHVTDCNRLEADRKDFDIPRARFPASAESSV